MKRNFIMTALIGFFITCNVSAQTGAWTAKVSPLLHKQVVEQQEAARHAAGREATETYVGALVKLAEGQNGSVLRREGTILLDSLDGTYIALLPASRIPAMASGDGVVAMEAQESGKMQMDVTHVTTGADKVQAGSTVGGKTIPAYTGKGVVVGISDSGFDYTHPMFSDAQGNLRIKKAWDIYAANGNGYGGIGAIYNTQQELLNAQGSKDMQGSHGTHVTGIAAGSPWTATATGGASVTYRGLAYEADIVTATAKIRTGNDEVDRALNEKLRLFQYNTNYLNSMKDKKLVINNVIDVLSIKMAFDYAAEHNMPCVVNCSWGHSLGYADRTAVEDEFIGKLTGPGRILVSSAGNEGDSYIYVEKPADQYEWHPLTTLKSAYSTFEIHSEDAFEVSVEFYKMGQNENQYNGKVTSEEVRKDYDEDPKTAFIFWNWKDKSGTLRRLYLSYRYEKSLTSGYDYFFEIDLPQDYYKDELAYMSLIFRSKKGFKMVGSPDRLLFGNENLFYNPYTVTWPGSHPQAITVGAMSHRNFVTNIAGEETYASGNWSPEGVLVNWSSCGPTLDGRQKPEVSAPGYNIISARSKHYSDNTVAWARDSKRVVARGKYKNEQREVVAMSGTSMAAPVMTGVVALWLQAKPTLTHDEIVATLSRTCKKPDSELTYPNYMYGYGEVDAYAGLLDILGVPTAIPTLSQKLVGVTLQGRTLHIEGVTEPTTVNVYTLSGQKVFTTRTADGIVTLPNLPAAVYAVQCGALGSSLIRM